MKFLGRLFLVVLLLGNLAYMGALSLHIVRSPEKTRLIPKGQTTLLETYVDTRNWTTSDMREHAAVVADINRAGRGDLIAHVSSPVTTVTPRAVAPSTPTSSTDKPAATSTDTTESTGKSIFDFTK